MYRKQVRRRRAVLIGLVLLGFLLLTITFGNGAGGIGGTLGTVLDPVTNAASRVFKPARDLANWFDETMAARGDRERLERELEEARGKAVAGEVALEDNRPAASEQSHRGSFSLESPKDMRSSRRIDRQRLMPPSCLAPNM